MPPWEANEWFHTPTVVQVPVGGAGAFQLCQANPQRVALIISAAFGAGFNVYVAPRSDVAAGLGYNLSQNNPSVSFLHADYGPLVAMDWFGTSSGVAGNYTIFEVVLRDWPAEDPAATEDVRDYLDVILQQIKALGARLNGNNSRTIYDFQKSKS